MTGEVKSGHFVADIDFSPPWVCCCCGWKTSAPDDRLLELEWNEHRRRAPKREVRRVRNALQVTRPARTKTVEMDMDREYLADYVR